MDLISGTAAVQANPFVVLTFIAAPAILTNASALMILSTSNRFARAIDRSRELSRQILEARKNNDKTLLDRLDNEILLTERRAVYLLHAIRAFYLSLGCFALGALVSLMGASLINIHIDSANQIFAVFSVLAVFLAVSGLIVGSVLLFRESRITVGILQDRIQRLHQGRRV